VIRLNLPYVDNVELEEIAQVLETGYYTQGKKTIEFENMVNDYVGSQFAFAMSSCTTALHLSLAALDIEPGDEVIVADFTFPATANVVVHQGAKPVLADIDLETFTLNIADLKAKISTNTRAIIPVHTFGCSADMEGIMGVSKEYDIPVIEDAACALGTTYQDQYCGNIGTLGCFSFHPRKVITTGEGGMITTNDERLAEKIQILRNHGGIREGSWYTYHEAGYNYRLSDINSAMGVAQMKKLEWVIEQKRKLAQELKSRLASIPGVVLPSDPPWKGHIYQSFVILVDKGYDRDRIISLMRESGVETTLGTYALHEQPYFQKVWGYCPGELQTSSYAYKQSITLPLYPQMGEAELDMISESLQAAVKAAERKTKR
jgi:perosamine synthetase